MISKEAKENLLIVPIPMTTTSKYLRGGNHAEYIAKEIGKTLNIQVTTNLLKRKFNTKKQAKTKNISDRLKNQKGSFKLINQEKYLGREIILVDDVLTTGATCEETKKLFLENGFKDVRIVTLAH